MKAKVIAYWITTALVALAMIAGGAFDMSRSPDVVAALASLGYPAYFATFLGFWKVLGGIAILAPRLPLIKEWAYAGIFFDLTAASFSHGASGDDAGKVVTPLVILGLMIASWALRPASRKLLTTASAQASGSSPSNAPTTAGQRAVA